MENLLVYLFPEIVCHAANECTLRKIGYLGSGIRESSCVLMEVEVS